MKRWLPLLLVLSLLFSLAGCLAPDKIVKPAEGELAVHFIDVGQADAALVFCGGQTMLIDGGNVEDSSLIASYLKRAGVSHLDYVINTHPDEDHVGGLSGALNVCSAGRVYSPVQEYGTKAFQDFKRYTEAQGNRLIQPTPGEHFALGGAEVEILGPQKHYDDPNNCSIVLKIKFGEISFLMTGDAEREAEQDLLEAGTDLSATVLKVGHHGSDTSTSYPFLRAVMPDYAIISVGEGNSYGHPKEKTLSLIRDEGARLYRTDLQGTIIACTDGSSLTFTTEKTADQTALNPTEPKREERYIGNRNSKRFHRESCGSLPAKKNQVVFSVREAATTAGYSPCPNCNP